MRAPDPLSVPGVAELAGRRQWVCWRSEASKTGRPTKIPHTPGAGRASSTDPSTWRSFEECWRAVRAGSFDGVGFVLAPGDGYAGLDLDDVIDGDGRVLDWALAVARLARSYTEVSPSGRGLRIIMRSDDLPAGFKRTKYAGSIEAYSQGRYLTITGDVLKHETFKHDPAVMADADLPTMADHPLFAGSGPDAAASPGPAAGGRDGRAPPDRPAQGTLGIEVSSERPAPIERLLVIFENHPDFRRVWMKKAPPSQDGTHSGYMASIARRLVDMGMDDQFTADCLVAFCRQHDRMDKTDARQVERAISFARSSDRRVKTPAAFDEAEKESEASERLDACRSDRDEALRELSAHFGAEVEDVIRLGKHPGRTSFKINGEMIDVGTPAAVMGQASVINALYHHRIAACPRVKPQRWQRIATLIMLHQREEDAADEEEVRRLEDYIAGLEVRDPDRDQLAAMRRQRMAHRHKGELFVFAGASGLSSKDLGLSRSIYAVLKEAGFESRVIKAKTTSRLAWVRPSEG